MAHQFFTKTQPPKPSSSSPPPPPPLFGSYNKPPIHPPPLAFSQSPPKSVSRLTSENPDFKDFKPPPYPHPISGYATPHPHITIEPVSTAHIPSLSRITSLLLPIRYPNSFYTQIITDPVVASISRVVIFHEHPVPIPAAPASRSSASAASKSSVTDKVVGGIRCRLERLSTTSPCGVADSQQEPTNLYIQTLHLLSPYRGNGVATSLLNSLLYCPSSTSNSKDESFACQVSELVRHYNIRTVTAHVHEANDEALEWYAARGFQVEDGVVEGYYRRLKPSGARIVKLNLNWDQERGRVVSSRVGESSGEEPAPSKPEGDSKSVQNDDDSDDDWEKIEAEDVNDHKAVESQQLNESKCGKGVSRKRKANDGDSQS